MENHDEIRRAVELAASGGSRGCSCSSGGRVRESGPGRAARLQSVRGSARHAWVRSGSSGRSVSCRSRLVPRSWEVGSDIAPR